MERTELILKLMDMLLDSPATKAAPEYVSANPLSPIRVGNPVLIITVTRYYTGRIVGVTDSEILIEDAAWIADTGRFFDAFRDGELSEFEAYPDGVVSVARGCIVDVSTWPKALVRGKK